MTKPRVYRIEASPPILNALIKNMHVDDLIYKLQGVLLSSSSKKASKREKEKSPVVHYAHHLNSQDGWICVDQRNNVYFPDCRRKAKQGGEKQRRKVSL